MDRALLLERAFDDADRRRDDGGGAAADRVRLGDALLRTGSEDRQAFRQVYELTSAKLFGICLRVCGNRQAAEDVLHDVYLTVWRRAGAWDPARGSAMTWLATIARNRAIDWRRSRHRRRFVPIAAAAVIADPAPDAETLLLLAEAERSLYDCLSGLEERQRDAIRTAFFEGATYAELAERRGVPLGTMKSWVRRGLFRMRAGILPSNEPA